MPTLSIILSTTIIVFRKKQTRRNTNKLIRNKTELLGQKKTASKKIIIAIGCCFMTDVSIYTHKTTPSFERLKSNGKKHEFKEKHISQFATAKELYFGIPLWLVSSQGICKHKYIVLIKQRPSVVCV